MFSQPILVRHIANTINMSILLVTSLIIAMVFMLTLVEELAEDDVGYTFAEAVSFAAATLPGAVKDTLPFTIFLGVLVGLGNLAQHSEITVMRAAGLSTFRLFAIVCLPMVFWVAVGFLFSEVVAPDSSKAGEVRKQQAQYGKQAIEVRGQLWLRLKGLYMSVAAIDERGDVWGVTQYHVDNTGQLLEMVTAASATFDRQRKDRWYLKDVTRTQFGDGKIRVSKEAESLWLTGLTPRLLESQAFVDPDKMAITDLVDQVAYAELNDLEATEHKVAVWSRLLGPLGVIALGLLAIAFVVGPLREVSMSARLVAGVFAGLSVKYAQDMVAPISIVFGVPPLLAVLVPIVLTWMVAFWAVRRI